MKPGHVVTGAIAALAALTGIARADHASPGTLVTLRSGSASSVAVDLGGSTRDGRSARTFIGAQHQVVERLPLSSRRSTPPVEWGPYVAVGGTQGLAVRVAEGRIRTIALDPVEVRPIVMPSGELFVAMRNGRVAVLGDDLTVRVEAHLTGAARPSPLALPDGSVVLTTTDRRLVRLDADLAPIFDVPLAASSAGLSQAPAFLAPDRLVVSVVDRVCVFDLSGVLLSSTELGDRIAAPPVVSVDGTVHVLLAGGHVAVLDHARRVRTRLALGARVLADQSSMLALDDDGSYRVAVPTLGVIALDADGTTRWTATTDAPFHGPIGIDAAHRTLAFDRRGRLGVISATGDLEERLELGGISQGFPMIASDGSLWATTDASELVHVAVETRPNPSPPPVTGVTLGAGVAAPDARP
jgi:outer membrane protein assembly factor BamB